jgi:hypothetical protein
MSEGHTATREAAMAAFAGAGGGSEQAPRAGRLLHDGPGLDIDRKSRKHQFRAGKWLEKETKGALRYQELDENGEAIEE